MNKIIQSTKNKVHNCYTMKLQFSTCHVLAVQQKTNAKFPFNNAYKCSSIF